ncbi:MAG: class I SAM-dependent methyltransferase [Candidatus Scalindua sp.]|nr:class I SAM-dependent methyltransferase [Candidatus Scalindua sp.]
MCSHIQLMERPTPEQLNLIYLGDYTSVLEKGTFEKDDNMAVECKTFLDFAMDGSFNKGARILEIGCFDGAFLSLFGEEYILLGAEPNPMGKVAAEHHRVQVVPKYFSPNDFTASSIDLVIMRHLIEHIPEPLKILEDCRKVLKSGGRLLIETPWIEHTLTNNVIGNFYHQHLHYFSRDSLTVLLERAGFAVVARGYKDFRQFVLAAPSGTQHERTRPLPYAETIRCQMDSYNSYLEDLRSGIQSWLESMEEPLAIYGASSIATGIVHLGGVPKERLAYLVDGDLRKQNMILPATEAFVRSPNHLLEEPVGAVFVASDFFKDEIIGLLRGNYSDTVHCCIVVHPKFKVLNIREPVSNTDG